MLLCIQSILAKDENEMRVHMVLQTIIPFMAPYIPLEETSTLTPPANSRSHLSPGHAGRGRGYSMSEESDVSSVDHAAAAAAASAAAAAESGGTGKSGPQPVYQPQAMRKSHTNPEFGSHTSLENVREGLDEGAGVDAEDAGEDGDAVGELRRGGGGGGGGGGDDSPGSKHRSPSVSSTISSASSVIRKLSSPRGSPKTHRISPGAKRRTSSSSSTMSGTSGVNIGVRATERAAELNRTPSNDSHISGSGGGGGLGRAGNRTSVVLGHQTHASTGESDI